MNRLCFVKMGDMNWHAHCGIYTYPIQVAVKFKIPLIMWGEHGPTDLSGMYSMNDFVEMTDAVGDLLYVVIGAAVTMGVNLTPIFDEIHRTNMAKVGG